MSEDDALSRLFADAPPIARSIAAASPMIFLIDAPIR